MPADSALAQEIMSGFRSNVSLPHMAPVRPKPQITSSAMNSRLSYFANDRLHLLPVGARRDDVAAGAHHQLADEGWRRCRDLRPGSAPPVRRPCAWRTVPRICRRCRCRAPVRELGVAEVGQGQAEIGVHVGLARGADRGGGAAVIAFMRRPTIFPLVRFADGGVVSTSTSLIAVSSRFGAGTLEQQHLAHRHRRDLRSRRSARSTPFSCVLWLKYRW